MTENDSKTTEKKPYNAPILTVYGDIEVLTLGFNTGNHLDATFPNGTPFGQLTFS